MATGRIVRPVICKSDKVALLKSDSARLLFTWLIPNADVEGNYYANPKIVKAHIFTMLDKTNEQVADYLLDIASVGLIKIYKENNQFYLYIVNFEEMQIRLDKKREKPKYPLITRENIILPKYLKFCDGKWTEIGREVDGNTSEKRLEVNVIEVKGREVKANEKNTKEEILSTVVDVVSTSKDIKDKPTPDIKEQEEITGKIKQTYHTKELENWNINDLFYYFCEKFIGQFHITYEGSIQGDCYSLSRLTNHPYGNIEIKYMIDYYLERDKDDAYCIGHLVHRAPELIQKIQCSPQETKIKYIKINFTPDELKIIKGIKILHKKIFKRELDDKIINSKDYQTTFQDILRTYGKSSIKLLGNVWSEKKLPAYGWDKIYKRGELSPNDGMKWAWEFNDVNPLPDNYEEILHKQFLKKYNMSDDELFDKYASDATKQLAKLKPKYRVDFIKSERKNMEDIKNGKQHEENINDPTM